MPPKKRKGAPKKKAEDSPPPKRGKSARVAQKEEDAAADEEACGKWERDGTLLYLKCSALKPSKEIIGFDMDWTLIGTSSGKTFATSRTDWEWMFDDEEEGVVVKKLKELHDDGKRVVIFTNQSGINGKNGWDESKANQIRGKIQDLSKELGFPLQAVASTTDDQWRKPQTAMWDYFVKNVNGGLKPDLKKCIYVGDAAGRHAGWKKGVKKDFSCSDRKFAFNVGIEFQTPEEYFLGHDPLPDDKWDWEGAIDPTSFEFEKKITKDDEKTFHSDEQEIIVCCGFPGAGKSTFSKRYLVPHGYVHVNRDTLKTPKACYKKAIEALDDGKSVIVDNTMPKAKSDDKDSCSGRDAYIELGKEYKVPVRCFRFDTSLELAKHLNYYRERLTNGEQVHVPRIGYAVFNKAFVEPSKKEGFTEIKKIQFVPQFADERAKTLFKQFA